MLLLHGHGCLAAWLPGCATWKPEIRNGSQIRNAWDAMPVRLQLSLSLSSRCLALVPCQQPIYFPPTHESTYAHMYIHMWVANAFFFLYTRTPVCCSWPHTWHAALYSRFASGRRSRRRIQWEPCVGVNCWQLLRFMHSKIGNKRWPKLCLHCCTRNKSFSNYLADVAEVTCHFILHFLCLWTYFPSNRDRILNVNVTRIPKETKWF